MVDHMEWPPVVDEAPLLLAPPPKTWKGSIEIFKSCAAFVQSSEFEQAGRSYHHRATGQIASLHGAVGSGTSAGGIDSVVDEEKPFWKLKKKVKLTDYYGLLGLQELNVMATEDQIRKAYRAMSMLCHPDKSTPEDREKAEARFKAMQKAFETLTDTRRRIYDSTLEFDESVPDSEAGNTEETFFKVYEPVFKRNERFSNILPVPQLGDMSTPIEEVDNFYDFWSNFKTWREPPNDEDDHEPTEETDDRHRKRELEREAAKARERKRALELRRVRSFVEAAMKKDPRRRLAKQRAEEEKERRKKEKLDAKNAAAAEIARAKAEAAAALEREKAAQAAAANAAKKAKERTKSQRKSLKKFCKLGVAGEFSADEVELLTTTLEAEQLEPLLALFSPAGAPTTTAASSGDDDEKGGKVPVLTEEQKTAAQAAFHAEVVRIQGAELTAKKRAAEKLAAEREAARKAAEEAAAMAKAVWSHDELSMMAKATVKYPVGTVKRWELITEMVNSVGKRTMKEVIAKSKEAAGAPGAERMGEAQAFELYLKKVEKAKTKAEVEQVVSDQQKRATASLIVTTTADATAKGLIKTEEKAAPATPAPAAAPAATEEVKSEAGQKKLSKAELNALKAAQAEAAEKAEAERKKAHRAASSAGNGKKAPKTSPQSSPTNATTPPAAAAATEATPAPKAEAAKAAAPAPAKQAKGKTEAKQAATPAATPAPASSPNAATNGKPAKTAASIVGATTPAKTAPPAAAVPAKTAAAAPAPAAPAKTPAGVPAVITPAPVAPKWAAIGAKLAPKAEAPKAATITPAAVANGRAPVAVSTIPVKKAAAAAASDDDGWQGGAWNSDQQLALESALRTVPKEVSDRWAAIAALVPGKTKKECVERFKQIKSQILAARQ